MVISSSNVSIPLSFPGHPLRYPRLFRPGSGSDHYQGLGTLPCLSLLLESPLAIGGLLTLISLILCSSSSLSSCQSLISSKCYQPMSLLWNTSPGQFLMRSIYSFILTPRTKLCPSGLVHLHDQFLQYPTPRTNSPVPGFPIQLLSIPYQVPQK